MSETRPFCPFCGVAGDWPDTCRNTRDVEDFAVLFRREERGRRCLEALRADPTLGERGYARVAAEIAGLEAGEFGR